MFLFTHTRCWRKYKEFGVARPLDVSGDSAKVGGRGGARSQHVSDGKIPKGFRREAV